jgi:hypothetical protein
MRSSRLYWHGSHGKTLKISLVTGEGQEGWDEEPIESLPSESTEPNDGELARQRNDRPALKAASTP